MMKRSTNILAVTAIVIVVGVFLLPQIAAAQLPEIINIWEGTGSGGSTCNLEGPCTSCDAIVVMANVLNIIFKASIFIASMAIVYGGILMMIDPVNPGLFTKGKNAMRDAGIGLAIVLLSYTAVGIVLRVLVHTDNVMPWANITCI